MSATPLSPEAALPPLARGRLEAPFVAVLVAAAVAIGYVSGLSAVLARPWLFCAMLLALVGLLMLEDEVFDGGRISPTTVASLAIALVFGPGGVVLAEAVLLGRLLAPTRKPLRALFDFGSLSLAGAAAGGIGLLLPAEGDALVLTGALAGIAYFAVTAALLVAVWALSEGARPLDMWHERIKVGAPPELAYGPAAGLLVLGGQELGPMVLALVGVPVATIWVTEKGAIKQLGDANARLRALMLQTVESLARTIEARDPYTGGHTERVGLFASAIARRLGFEADDLRALEAGAVIHDLGKIGIPDAVLLKAGPLDDAEWAEMRRHPEIGAYIVGELEIAQIAKDMTRHHHERYDGGGYPDGLAGEAIPLAARILTVADALDAMTSDRPYRKALPMQVALDEVEAKAGTQFCPKVVEALRGLDLTSA